MSKTFGFENECDCGGSIDDPTMECERCQFHAEVVRLNKLNAELAEVLEDLMGVQNGAPLFKWEKEWEETMQRAYKILAIIEENKNGD